MIHALGVRSIPLLLSLLLAGCLSTPPSAYYLLSSAPGPDPVGTTPSIGIGPIEVPEYLKRSGLVYSRAGDQLEISRFERWAEPLADGVQRVLSLNLASRLDTQSIQPYPWPQSQAPDYGVSVVLLALIASETTATLVAEWTVNRPGKREALSRRISRLQQPLGEGEFSAGQIPPAYSELLDQLSELIAASISAD